MPKGTPVLISGQETDQVTVLIWLIVAFQVKHFIADFLFQNKYILSYRHRYGHPAGILHVAIHALFSAIILWLLPINILTFALILGAEAVVHYHIDWLKEQVNRRLGLGPNSSLFWIALGFDQLLHQLTYVGMIAWLMCAI